MKFAVTGKGGTGKTTVAGILAHLFARDGHHVLAVDADPDANLASAIGIPEDDANSITPISKQSQLVTERTGAKPRQFGQLFRMNPRVSDIPDKYCLEYKGIKLLVLGAIQKGGAGCACPENVLLRSLLSEIILNRDEVVIVDMEAGIEHLGRGTSRSIDSMLIVVEPGSRSVSSAKTIMKLAQDIEIESFGIIGNKVQDKTQENWIRSQFPQDLMLGMVSYRGIIRKSDQSQRPLIELLDESLSREFDVLYQAVKRLRQPG
jgi:CO dehydrogenase maturation factor